MICQLLVIVLLLLMSWNKFFIQLSNLRIWLLNCTVKGSYSNVSKKIWLEAIGKYMIVGSKTKTCQCSLVPKQKLVQTENDMLTCPSHIGSWLGDSYKQILDLTSVLLCKFYLILWISQHKFIIPQFIRFWDISRSLPNKGWSFLANLIFVRRVIQIVIGLDVLTQGI